MGKRIHLKYSDLLPAAPSLRKIERYALADRESLGYRFGEPCDPRRLVDIYDVDMIIETHHCYKQYLQQEAPQSFEQKWSGVTFLAKPGKHLMLINPDHSPARRTFTIAHEFGHLVFDHQPVKINQQTTTGEMKFSNDQEFEAFSYGLAVLLPYAPLLQMMEQGATVRGIAHHYGVSNQAVLFRTRTCGL